MRQLIWVHISANVYIHIYIHTCTYVCGKLGMSLVMLNFLGVTLRNIIFHSNFCKYDEHGARHEHS